MEQCSTGDIKFWGEGAFKGGERGKRDPDDSLKIS